MKRLLTISVLVTLLIAYLFISTAYSQIGTEEIPEWIKLIPKSAPPFILRYRISNPLAKETKHAWIYKTEHFNSIDEISKRLSDLNMTTDEFIGVWELKSKDRIDLTPTEETTINTTTRKVWKKP